MTDLEKLFLKLGVTEEDLDALKANRSQHCWMHDRHRMILDELRGTTGVAITTLCSDGQFRIRTLLPNEKLRGDGTYRIGPDVQLPRRIPEKRNPDDHDPFLHTVDGEEVLCCPVYVWDDEVLHFISPKLRAWTIGLANSMVDFLGLMTADENGWPDMWCGAIARDYTVVAGINGEPGPTYTLFTITVQGEPLPPNSDEAVTPANVEKWLVLVPDATRNETIKNPLTNETMTRQQATGVTFTNIGKAGPALGAIAALDRYDVSLCLSRQPDDGEKIAFVCFRKGGE